MKFAGFDWAQSTHVLVLLEGEGKVLLQQKVPHTPSAVAEVLRLLETHGGPREVLVSIEPGAPLLTDQLLQAGYQVYPLNPRQAERFRDRHSMAGAKDDFLDAFVHADALRTDLARLRPMQPNSPLTEEIRLRDRARSRRVEDRTRAANQLRDVLQRYFPAVLTLARDMHDGFFLALLRTYGDPDAARKARADVVRRLLQRHRIRALDVPAVLDCLRAPGFIVPAHVVQACRDEVADLVAQIELLNQQIERSAREIDARFEEHPDRELYLSLPGLGTCLAARVMAELGDSRDRWPDPSSLQSQAGTAPVTRRSGKGRPVVRLRRGCNRRLQAALFAGARASCAASPWARAYLAAAKARGVRHATAARALSNKWAKILWAVLTTRTPYDEARHVRDLLRESVPWAATLARPAQEAVA